MKKIPAIPVLVLVALLAGPVSADPARLIVFSTDGAEFTMSVNGQPANRRASQRVELGDIRGDYAFVSIELAGRRGGRKFSAKIPLTEFPSVSDSLLAKRSPVEIIYGLTLVDGEYRLELVSVGKLEKHASEPAVASDSRKSGARSGSTEGPVSIDIQADSNGFRLSLDNGAVQDRPPPEDRADSAPSFGKGCKPMDPDRFNGLLKTIGRHDFEDSKLNSTRRALDSNCISSRQLGRLLRSFDFDDSRIELAVEMHERVSDPENFHEIHGVFSMDAAIDELNEELGWDDDW